MAEYNPFFGESVAPISEKEYEALVLSAKEKIAEATELLNQGKPTINIPELEIILKSFYVAINEAIHKKLFKNVEYDYDEVFNQCLGSVLDSINKYTQYYYSEKEKKPIKASFRRYAVKNIYYTLDGIIGKIIKKRERETDIRRIGDEDTTEGDLYTDIRGAEETFMPKEDMEKYLAENVCFGLLDKMLGRLSPLDEEEKTILRKRIIDNDTYHEIAIDLYGDFDKRTVVKKKWDKIVVKIRKFIGIHRSF